MATKPAFATGAQVEHGKFGLGSVLSCNDEYIVIKFDDFGEKKFDTSIVLPSLKKSDRQPPVEKRHPQKGRTRRRSMTRETQAVLLKPENATSVAVDLVIDRRARPAEK